MHRVAGEPGNEVSREPEQELALFGVGFSIIRSGIVFSALLQVFKDPLTSQRAGPHAIHSQAKYAGLHRKHLRLLQSSSTSAPAPISSIVGSPDVTDCLFLVVPNRLL